jgi:DNA repair protein RecN (Recombination protein N)
MLSNLNISNYAITEHLDIELKTGMTVLTGETGAGKSIMLDALGLALGDRADSNIVRSGADRADIQRHPRSPRLAEGARFRRQQ